MINELFLYRGKTNDLDTPGIMVYNNDIICHTLEDHDRELYDTMTLKEIQAIKIYGVTAIPYGRYGLVWYDSPKHGRVLLLIGVKGFSYVEIHSANWATQLLGCIAPGLSKGTNSVHDSRNAVKLINKIVLDNNIKFINILKQK